MTNKQDPFQDEMTLGDIASLRGQKEKQPPAAAPAEQKPARKRLLPMADMPAASAPDKIIINPNVGEKINENAEEGGHAVFAFGRFNPPTVGHEKLIHAVEKVADEHGVPANIVASHTQNKDKDPLPQAKKIGYLNKITAPGTNVTGSSKEEPTFLQYAAKLHKQGVQHLHMVAGSDRVKEYEEKLKKYNGTHEGALFNFKSITVHSAGQRDPDAEGVEGMSGTKMRAHARAGEMEEFKSGLPDALKSRADEIAKHIRKVAESAENDTEDTMKLNEHTFTDKERIALHEKALKSGVKFAVLREVYRRGIWAYKYHTNVNQTAEQYAFARVNSFISLGEAYHMDKDLRDVDEAVDLQARMKRKVTMAMYRKKIERAREIASKRFAKNKNLRARSLKIARNTLRKRLGGARGAGYSKLSSAQKIAVDKLLDGRQKQIKAIANKIITRVKRDEANRMAGTRTSTAKAVVASYEPASLNTLVEKYTKKVGE